MLKGGYDECNSQRSKTNQLSGNVAFKAIFMEMCKRRQALCDIMWQTEHPHRVDSYLPKKDKV